MAFTNGSPRATIETDEERTYFLIDIPCHPYFARKEVEIEASGVKGGVKELPDIQEVILKEMQFDSSITTSEMAQKTGIKFRTLQRHISLLQAMGGVVRKDGRKDDKRGSFYHLQQLFGNSEQLHLAQVPCLHRCLSNAH